MRLVPVTRRPKRIAGKLVRVNAYALVNVGQAAGAVIAAGAGLLGSGVARASSYSGGGKSQPSALAIGLIMTFLVAGARAQVPAPAPANSQPSAQQVQQNQQMVQAATEVGQLVDKRRTGEVWDGASTVAKQVVPRDAFISKIFADRQALGNLISRQLAVVSYQQSDGKLIPAGQYANVAFASRFPNARQAVRELVSFHLDDDHVWRVSGYALR